MRDRYTGPVRWLALDVGAKRVGVALSDSKERVATPSGTIPFASPQDLAERVAGLVRSWGVEAVLVGVPITRSGQSRGERRAREVIAALSRLLSVPVVGWDERGTTREAQALLAQRGLSARQQRDKLDALAAALLLESFLAVRRNRTGGNEVAG